LSKRRSRKTTSDRATLLGVSATFAILVILAGAPALARNLEGGNPLLTEDHSEPQEADGDKTTPEAADTSETGSADQPDAPTANQADTAEKSELPDYAKGTAKEKTKRLADAVRGLVTWNLFDDRVTVRAYARVQVDGTVANGDDALEAGDELGHDVLPTVECASAHSTSHALS